MILSGTTSPRSPFHYETQPLPTWLGWYAHQLPDWLHKTSAALMFAIELAIPLLIFVPKIRHLGLRALNWPPTVHRAHGNYCFFNLLTIALCLLLIDDAALRWLSGFAIESGLGEAGSRAFCAHPPRLAKMASPTDPAPRLRFSLDLPAPVSPPCSGFPSPGRGAGRNSSVALPVRSFNTYGLFAIMTTSRPEIIIAGSNDASPGLLMNSNISLATWHAAQVSSRRISHVWIGKCGSRL